MPAKVEASLVKIDYDRSFHYYDEVVSFDFETITIDEFKSIICTEKSYTYATFDEHLHKKINCTNVSGVLVIFRPQDSNMDKFLESYVGQEFNYILYTNWNNDPNGKNHFDVFFPIEYTGNETQDEILEMFKQLNKRLKLTLEDKCWLDINRGATNNCTDIMGNAFGEKNTKDNIIITISRGKKYINEV